MKKNVSRKASLEVNPTLQKGNGNSVGSLDAVEQTNPDVNKELEKDSI